MNELPANHRGRDFVIGDIHGRFATLEYALDAVRYEADRDRLVSLGDLIDHGPRSDEALEWIAASPHGHVLPPAWQLCADSGASMAWRRMRSDPILSVSPSVTDATPEMPAAAAMAATRTRERKARARGGRGPRAPLKKTFGTGRRPKRRHPSRRGARPWVGRHKEAQSSSSQTVPERE